MGKNSSLDDSKNASRFHFSQDLMQILTESYGQDAFKAAEAMKKMYTRYYFRANTLRSSIREIMSNLKRRGLTVFQDERVPEALYFPVKGPHSIPVYEKVVVVDDRTAESILQGAHVYAPGITSCPKVRRNDVVTVINKGGQNVGSGIARMHEHSILSYRKGLAIEITDRVYDVPCLREMEEYQEGLIYPQSFPAMVTVRVLNPKPGMVIADLNCSPGGKLSHICQLTQNKALVYGMDRSKKKIEVTRETINRLGCRNVILSIQDTRYVNVDHPNLKVDVCIVDPPCSALGITPKLHSDIQKEDVKSVAKYQIQFLKAASQILKPNGKLVYSVCTLTIDECEKIVSQAVKFGLETIPQEPFIGCKGIEKELPPRSHIQRFHPQIQGTGYCIALFKRSF